jgi:hypothetical protein
VRWSLQLRLCVVVSGYLGGNVGPSIERRQLGEQVVVIQKARAFCGGSVGLAYRAMG